MSSVFNDSEGLYRNKTVCRCLAHRIGLIIPRVQYVSGPWSERVFSSDTPPKCLHRDCVGRRRTGTRHGNVYLSVREKREIVVYRQRVLQTVTSLGVLSLVFCRKLRPPENRKFYPLEKIGTTRSLSSTSLPRVPSALLSGGSGFLLS